MGATLVSLGIVYVGLLLLGVFYALLTGALGWVSDLFGGGDVGHVDASGHLDAGHVHPLSGTTVATFITGFGAGGTVGHYLLDWGSGATLALATGSGLGLAGAAYLLLDVLFHATQGGSEFPPEAAVGREAEVITPIPADGTGEIAFQVKGQREHAPARSLDGSAVPRGRLVLIEKFSGTTAYVRPRG